MKEKEVHLTLEEIDYLLKGTIHWDDIESRVNAPQRKPIELGKEPSSKNQAGEDWGLKRSQARQAKAYYEPFLEGNKVYWIISGVGALTLGTWVYFVFAK